mmetsp:Transcript_31212/g.36010  ORF Transcript_31212/g.36010 Transcript_31212/m.36010 type:complete len:95 (-) Transcript_31212:501-785(-)
MTSLSQRWMGDRSGGAAEVTQTQLHLRHGRIQTKGIDGGIHQQIFELPFLSETLSMRERDGGGRRYELGHRGGHRKYHCGFDRAFRREQHRRWG